MNEWTEHDTDILRKEYSKCDLSELSKRLDRSLIALQKKAHYIGVKRKSRTPWTAEKDSFLKENYKNKSVKDIAEILNKTRISVIDRAVQLGLKKTNLEYSKVTVDLSNLTQSELGYLAGLIDGEGTITISLNSKRTSIYQRTRLLQPMVSICNTNHAIVDWLSIRLPFVICKQRYDDSKKDTYALKLSGYKIESLLRTVLPYLVAKKRQAELILEFLQSRTSSQRKSKYSDREIEIVNEIRALNGKGKTFHFRFVTREILEVS